MIRPMPAVLLCALGMGLCAQEAPRSRPFLVHLGTGQVDPGAGSLTPVVELGVPILNSLGSYLGAYAGATSWSRGSYAPSSVAAGSLLQKKAYWGGAYWGDRFWTVGAAAEWASQATYTPPVHANDWYSGITRNRFGAGGFVSLHRPGGLGAFVRAGSASGVGAGLSLNF